MCAQFECELLSEMKVRNEAEALRACEALHAKGCAAHPASPASPRSTCLSEATTGG